VSARPNWRLALAALALLCANAFGQAPAAAADCPAPPASLDEAALRQGMQQARDHGILWRIEKGGRSSWLYGTIHVARRDWIFPGPALIQAVQQSDQLALELDVMDPDIMGRLQAAMMAKPGAPALPPELARRLSVQAQAACLGDALAAMRPEMQAMTLGSLVGRRQGLEPAYGIDVFLAGMARGMRKTAISLETPEAQLALLLHDDPAETNQQVAEMLDELERGTALSVLQRMAQDWADSRLDDLAAYPQWCDCLNTEEQRSFNRRLLDERNQAMAPRIAALHAGGQRTLVAVGALHMIGPQGLPALMQAQGFKVERVLPRP
jgi:uncharacterized protein YbaP (TraB family)